MEKKKIAIIGGGNIGGTLTLQSALRGIREIVLFDKTGDFAKGKALDIMQSLAIERIDCDIIGTDDYKDISGSDVVIVTAGVPRGPGMSRDDLLSVNADVMRVVAKGIAQYAKDAFVIVVTNPLDAMVYALQKLSGLPSNRVIGMGGVLDSARFKLFLAHELKVSVQDVEAFVLGGHGDAMVPLYNSISVAGIPLRDLIQMNMITSDKAESIIERTRKGGGEIISLLKKGSAFYAPASAALAMAFSYMNDEKRIMPCAAYLNGEYGFSGLYVGVSAIIGASGLEKIIEIELKENERAAFEKSVESVKKLLHDMEKFL
ncbi:MAG: malate dehydrogenase [Proteobacteria bacterium]|nr:malate dehydrogenase [Pseudomonadota bacterium]